MNDEQWVTFDKQGFVHLGKVIPVSLLDSMRARITKIMDGEVHAIPTATLLQYRDALLLCP